MGEGRRHFGVMRSARRVYNVEDRESSGKQEDGAIEREHPVEHEVKDLYSNARSVYELD